MVAEEKGVDALEARRYYVAEGTCPGCGEASHPGTTCRGDTTEDVLERLMSKWRPDTEPEPAG